jgi:guanidinoacetate N-methyltransferase
LSELVFDLEALDRTAAELVPGTAFSSLGDRAMAELADEEIMEDWQIPLMAAMARIVTASKGHVLEIGFGRGIASQLIQQGAPASHTIIECNESIVRRFESWRKEWRARDIRMVRGMWQDALPELDAFDAVFFHTYPLNEAEAVELIGTSVTFAEHFFEHAAAHLVDGGVFTYLSNEIDSLSRAHQRSLLRHFRSIEVSVVRDLDVPADVRDSWWARSMAVVKAVR